MPHAGTLSNLTDHGSRRVVWVDVARVMAALFIIANHISLYNPLLYRALWAQFLFARTPFFLVTAAYFVGRGTFGDVNGKCWFFGRRAWFLLKPYLIWCFVSLFLIGNSVYNEHVADYAAFYAWLGGGEASFGDALAALGKCFGIAGHPVDAPMWFLRDIIIYTFAAPILLRVKGYVLPIGLILLSFNFFGTGELGHDWPTPDSLGFFCLGLFLSRYSLDKLTDILRPYCLFFSIMLLPLSAWLVFNRDQFSTMMVVLGLLCLASVALLFTEKLPDLASKVARLAPAGFLVFGVHYILIVLIRDSGVITCEGWRWDLLWLGLVPVIYAVICAAFFLMRRVCPRALPVLAGFRCKAGCSLGKSAGDNVPDILPSREMP